MALRTHHAHFETPSLVAHEVHRMRLVHELGRPSELWVDLSFLGSVEGEAMLGESGALSFGFAGEPLHIFQGIVDEVTVIGSTAHADRPSQRIHVRVVSEIGLLDRSFGCQIFQEMDVREIVEKVLDDHGISANRQEWRLSATYPKREYCVQYQETALDFICRLLEEEGIYFFEQAEESGASTLVFCDQNESLTAIDGAAEVPFRGRVGFNNAEDFIVSIAERHAVRSGEFVLRDYDFKRPSLDMTVTASADIDTDLSVYDYPGLYVEPSDGERLAKVRLEAEQVLRQTVEIEAVCPRLSAGRTVSLTESARPETDGEYVLVGVVHQLGTMPDNATMPAYATIPSASRGPIGSRSKPASKDSSDVLRTTATLLPRDTAFRTAQSTPRPIIEGAHTARVVAPDGSQPEEIHTDEHGRCKVKFHWDLAPEDNDKASCWMRVGQLQTSGSMVLPRVDWEVIVEFADGNPDRPMVTGKFYNGEFMPPYSLPGGNTRTSLQTASTPGGGGTNEIRFEDAAGAEEIMIRAQYDWTTKVANNKTKNVNNNETKVVAVDSSSSVGANESVKITKGARTTVGGDQSLSVGGNRSVEVNAVTGHTSGGSSSHTIGGNHFEMDGNPLQGLLALATAKALEYATAKAGEVMAQVDAAVQAKVDQVMGPVNALQQHGENLQAGMQAIQGGDLGGAAGLLANAAGVPLPGPFASALPGAPAAPAATASPGGGSSTAGVTGQLGVDQAVNNAIQQGIQGGANALAAAMGVDGVGGGGASLDNLAGPEGDVDGIDGEDRTKGPGHSLNKVDGNHSEAAGSMRITAALNGVMTNVGVNQVENIGAIKATMALGNIAASVEGAKSESEIGLVVVSRADESEQVGAAKTQMVGGAILEKIGGGHSITAGAPATFIGAFHKVEAGGKITFKCGASEVVVDSGGISITSPMVAITAGKIQLTKATTEI